MDEITVLVCDDDREIVEAIEIYLRQEGYRVLKAYDGEEAIRLLSENKVELLLIDVMMPKLDGIRATLRIRETSSVPIIILSAKSEDVDKILGLNIGADDYITKPFGVMELISRVKALMRRSRGMEEERMIRLGPIFMDDEKRAVFVDDQQCELTYKEYELLKLLLLNAGIVASRDMILDRVWGTDFEGESRTLDMHIKTLRQKLGSAGPMIRTVRNVGYMLTGEDN